MIQVKPAIRLKEMLFKRSFTFNEANWKMFANQMDQNLDYIEPVSKYYEKFIVVYIRRLRLISQEDAERRSSPDSQRVP